MAGIHIHIKGYKKIFKYPLHVTFLKNDVLLIGTPVNTFFGIYLRVVKC